MVLNMIMLLVSPYTCAGEDTVQCQLRWMDSLFLIPTVRHLGLVIERRFLPYDLEFTVWWTFISSFIQLGDRSFEQFGW